MKASKQERMIAIITGTIVTISAILLFVSGLGDKIDNTESTNEGITDVYSINNNVSDSALHLSGVDSNIVGSAFAALRDSESEGTTEEVIEETTVAEVKEPYKYENTFIVNVDIYLNVRSTPNSEGEILGKIYPGGGGTVIEKGTEWSKVKSGNVEGYINNAYVWFGRDAEEHMPEVCTRFAISKADTLRVRKGPGTEYDVIAVVNTGTEVQVISVDGDWTKVKYIGKETYIATEYLDYYFVIEEGITIEEEQEAIRLEQERIAAEKAAAEKAAADKAAKIQQAINKSKFVETLQTSGYSVTEEDAYLLACVVGSEAGYESYEGKLAVANVVLNRLNGGYYGKTMYDVVYAKGQFTVATNGALNRVMVNGPNAESIQAAKDALAGKNNVPNYANFCSLKAANFDSYAEYSIICNQVFYKRR